MSQDLLQEAALLTKLLADKEAGRKFFKMFPDPPHQYSYDKYAKHLEFFAAGATYNERLFMAGNRVGKTEAGSYELVAHLTGEYPHWWTGRRFNKPISVWVAGDTTKTVRDIIQAKLIGPPESPILWGTGIVPKDYLLLDSITRISGVANAIDSFSVRHKDGWVNTVQLKSYEQGRKTFQGTEKDLIVLDEEPPKDIYDESLMRTMTTNGMVYLTFTPLSGMSEVVMSFMSDSPDEQEKSSHKYMVQATWDDVPHITPEAKAQMWAALPPHQRDARAKGVPTMGSGAIYPVAEEDITVDDFPIPPYWPRAYAMDVGWNNTAMVYGAKDLESGIIYITNVYKRGQAEPLIHADAITARVGRGTKGYIDPASRGRSQNDGVQLYQQYVKLNLNLDFAQNAVEAGLAACWEGLSTGKIKVFKSCAPFFAEYRLYRRDEKGKVVKVFDHIMDSFRYLIMSAQREFSRPRRGYEKIKQDTGTAAVVYKDLSFGTSLSGMWLGG